MLPREKDKEQLFLQAFRKGEEAAFDQLFREYFAALTYFAHQLIHHTAEAEDIVQDCFVNVWKARPALQDMNAVRNYLYAAVRNQCFKHLKKKARLAGVELMLPDEATIEKQLISAETAHQLLQLIHTLPAREQEVIRLYYLEDKTLQEISDILGTAYSTVRTQRLNALISLRKTKISLC